MKKFISRMTIRRKFVFFVLLFLFPMLTIGLLFNIINLRTSQDEILKTYNQALSVFADKIDSSLQRYQSIAHALTADRNLTALNQAPDDAGLSIIWEYADLLDQLRLFSSSNDMEGNITVYLPGKGRAFSSEGGILDFQDIGRFSECRIGLWEMNAEGMLSILYSSSGILSESSVLVTVDINPRAIESLLQNFSSDSEGIGFFSCADTVLFPSGTKDMDGYRLHDVLQGIEGQSQSGITAYRQQQSYQVHYQRSQNDAILYGFIYPENIFLRTAYFWIAVMLLYMAAAAILLLLFSKTVRKNLINPIYKLIAAFESVKGGNLNTQIQTEDTGEFGLLFRQFNAMTGRLNQSMKEIIQYQKLLENSKLKLLQSQINPHFLYNSLNFVYRMISSRQLKAAEQMTIYLGRYFTYATKANLDETTIEEEIKNIETYVAIQKLRFSGDIDLDVTVPEASICQAVIPRLLLQPIIENVFSHGVVSYEKKIVIAISFVLQDNKITIMVTDNGKGMDAGRLKQVKDNLGEQQREEGFALRNIFWRLKLIYGEAAQMEITSEEGLGTQVVLAFPAGTSSRSLEEPYV